MREIVQIGAPVLREVALEISPEDITGAHIRGIIADMKDLLAKEEYGVALAAPQVGEAVRLFVIASKTLIKRKRAKKKPEGEDDMDDDYLKGLPVVDDEVYINPTLVKMSKGRKDKHEGCLSVRGKWGMVPRAEKMTVRAYNEKGEVFERGASGFLAHIFQHEMDHLDGILYIDKATEVSEDESEHSDDD